MCTLHASCCAVYCNRSCLFVWGVWVGLLRQLLEIVCINPHQTGLICKGSDHLKLIKFWPSCAPEKRVCSGAKFLAPPYYSQHAVFVSPVSALSFYV